MLGEVVGVFAVFDDDVHGAGESLQFAGTGAWHYFEILGAEKMRSR